MHYQVRNDKTIYQIVGRESTLYKSHLGKISQFMLVWKS